MYESAPAVWRFASKAFERDTRMWTKSLKPIADLELYSIRPASIRVQYLAALPLAADM